MANVYVYGPAAIAAGVVPNHQMQAVSCNRQTWKRWSFAVPHHSSNA